MVANSDSNVLNDDSKKNKSTKNFKVFNVEVDNYLKKRTYVFLSFFPVSLVRKIAPKLILINTFFKSLNPELDEELIAIDHEYNSDEFVSSGLLSYNLLGIIFGYLVLWASLQKDRPLNVAILTGFGTWFIVVFLFTYLLVKSPKNILFKKGLDCDKSLIYALKELLLQNKSGAGLYESLVNLANSNYGELSKEFDIVVREVNTGMPLVKSLEKLAKRTKSDYFKKSCWQLINTVSTGSELNSTLSPIIEELDVFQKSQIENYARELNLWSLVYMMFSVAIPTIGSTMLVVLSVFANFGVTENFFIGFAVLCMVVQVVLIIFVGSRRPNVLF